MKNSKKCLYCNAEFYYSSRPDLCSWECYIYYECINKNLYTELKFCMHCSKIINNIKNVTKHCSNKCSKAYWRNKEVAKYIAENPDYYANKERREQNKLKKQKERQQSIEKRSLYEQLRSTHITQSELKQKTGLTSLSGFNDYYREIHGKELESIRCLMTSDSGNNPSVLLYDRSVLETVEKFKNNILPDGWVNRDYILQTLDIHEMTYSEYFKRWGRVPSERLFLNQKIFLKEEADKWIANIIAEKNAAKAARSAATLENKKLRELEAIKKHKQVLQRIADNKAKREAEKAAIHARKLHRKNNPKPKIYKVIRRKDDWTDWRVYEEKLKKKLAFGMPNYVKNDTVGTLQKNWLANIDMMNRGENGDIQYIVCTKCEESKPYYDFYADCGGNGYGRSSRCKLCAKSKKTNKNTNKKTAKLFATKLIASIRRHLSFIHGKYQDIPAKEIWAALGYTDEDLINHFLSLMEPWMNWENNRHIKSPDDKAWHMDHIKPKSSFEYKTIYDPQFKACWSLANLRPLEAKANLVKSDFHDINGKFRYLYKKFVVENVVDKNNIWTRYFSFSALEARQHLEANFCEGMTFDNHGDVWHIDHVIPLAAMPFDSLEDDNFKKVWHYTNLSPKFIKDNLAKNSKHENAKYFTKKS